MKLVDKIPQTTLDLLIHGVKAHIRIPERQQEVITVWTDEWELKLTKRVLYKKKGI